MSENESISNSSLTDGEHSQSTIVKEPMANNPKNTRLPFILSVLAIFLTLLAIAAATLYGTLYGIYLYKWQHSTESSLVQQQTLARQNQTLLVQLATDVKTLQAQMNNEITKIEERFQTLSNQINASGKLNNQRWIADSTVYLLRLANLNLQFNYDIPTTITLLETANQQLSQLNDPNTLKLQQAITNDILKLKAIPQADLSKTLIRLASINDAVASLPLNSAARFITPPSSNEDQSSKSTPTVSGWRGIWQQTSQTLQSLITIRRHDTPIEPLISPQQQVVLVQNLQLLLQQAQWAAIHHNANIYQSSLQQVQQLLKKYSTSTPATQALLNELTELQQLQISPTLPTLNTTLDLAIQLLQPSTAQDSPVTSPQNTSSAPIQEPKQ